MITLAAQRYGIAVFAFLLALVWQGIGIVSGLECLLTFTAVYLVVAAAQKRRAAKQRRVERRRTRTRPRVEPDDEEDAPEWPYLQSSY